MSNRIKISNVQQEMMVDFMEKNKNFCANLLTFNFTKSMRDEKWEELAESLNNCGLGCSKHVEKWKRTWMDMKKNTKKHAIDLRKAKTNGTGNQYSVLEPLSNLEKRIVALMGENVVYGVPSQESPYLESSITVEAPEVVTNEVYDTQVREILENGIKVEIPDTEPVPEEEPAETQGEKVIESQVEMESSQPDDASEKTSRKRRKLVVDEDKSIAFINAQRETAAAIRDVASAMWNIGEAAHKFVAIFEKFVDKKE